MYIVNFTIRNFLVADCDQRPGWTIEEDDESPNHPHVYSKEQCIDQVKHELSLALLGSGMDYFCWHPEVWTREVMYDMIDDPLKYFYGGPDGETLNQLFPAKQE